MLVFTMERLPVLPVCATSNHLSRVDTVDMQERANRHRVAFKVPNLDSRLEQNCEFRMPDFVRRAVFFRELLRTRAEIERPPR